MGYQHACYLYLIKVWYLVDYMLIYMMQKWSISRRMLYMYGLHMQLSASAIYNNNNITINHDKIIL